MGAEGWAGGAPRGCVRGGWEGKHGAWGRGNTGLGGRSAGLNSNPASWVCFMSLDRLGAHWALHLGLFPSFSSHVGHQCPHLQHKPLPHPQALSRIPLTQNLPSLTTDPLNLVPGPPRLASHVGEATKPSPSPDPCKICRTLLLKDHILSSLFRNMQQKVKSSLTIGTCMHTRAHSRTMANSRCVCPPALIPQSPGPSTFP